MVIPQDRALVSNGDKVGTITVVLPDGYIGISKGYLLELRNGLAWCSDELTKCKEK